MVSGGMTQRRGGGVILENKSIWGPQGEANAVHVVGFWWDNQHVYVTAVPEKKKHSTFHTQTILLFLNHLSLRITAGSLNATQLMLC